MAQDLVLKLTLENKKLTEQLDKSKKQIDKFK